MSKKQIAQNRTQPKKAKSFFVSVFLGTLLSLAIGLVLLLFSCLAALRMEDPERATPVLALISLFISAFSSGYIASRIHRENGFFCGLLSAIFLIGILVLLVFFFSFSIKISLFLICSPAIIIASCVSGVCGINTTTTKKHKKSKRF